MVILDMKYNNYRDKTSAAVFALIGGSVGAQKFYLGKTGQGVLCLLFFWTFIPAIIGVIEGICFLAMSNETFYRSYNYRYRL